MPADPLDHPGHSEAIDKIRDKVAQRLRKFCAHFSDSQFETLVRDVTRNEFVHGFKGPEKESRLQVFDTHYRAAS